MMQRPASVFVWSFISLTLLNFAPTTLHVAHDKGAAGATLAPAQSTSLLQILSPSWVLDRAATLNVK
jgi:hypothetical protein